jgi:hypothetical protein
LASSPNAAQFATAWVIDHTAGMGGCLRDYLEPMDYSATVPTEGERDQCMPNALLINRRRFNRALLEMRTRERVCSKISALGPVLPTQFAHIQLVQPTHQYTGGPSGISAAHLRNVPSNKLVPAPTKSAASRCLQGPLSMGPRRGNKPHANHAHPRRPMEATPDDNAYSSYAHFAYATNNRSSEAGKNIRKPDTCLGQSSEEDADGLKRPVTFAQQQRLAHAQFAREGIRMCGPSQRAKDANRRKPRADGICTCKRGQLHACDPQPSGDTSSW